MFLLDIWINAYNQHLDRAKSLYSLLTKEMQEVADEIIHDITKPI